MRILTAILLLFTACETEGVTPGADSDATGPARLGGSLVFTAPDASPELTPDARPVAPDTLPAPDLQPDPDARTVSDTMPAADTKAGPSPWCGGNCYLATPQFSITSGCSAGQFCTWTMGYSRPWCGTATKRADYGQPCEATGTVCGAGHSCAFDAKVNPAVKVCLRVCDLKNTGMTGCSTSGGFDEVCVPNPIWKCADGSATGGVCLTRGSQFVSG